MVERLGKRDASEESFRGRRNSAAEDGARDLLIDVVEWVHRAFYPGFVDLQS